MCVSPSHPISHGRGKTEKKSAVPIAEGVTVELQTEIMWSHLSQLRVLESEGGEVLLLLTMSSYYSD